MRAALGLFIFAAVLLPTASPVLAARSVVILHALDDEAGGRIASALAQNLANAGRARVLGIRLSDLTDPIRSGRLLAQAGRAGVRVAVGDEMSAFAAREFPSGALLLLSVSHLPIHAVGRPETAAIFSFRPAALFPLLGEKFPGPAYILITPEQRSIGDVVKRAGTRAGFKPQIRVVASSRELRETVDGLWEDAGSVWLIGDGRITGAAPFSHLVERSIAEGVPLVSGRAADVRLGVFAAYAGDPAALAEEAARLIKGSVALPWKSPGPLRLSPDGGKPVVNSALRKRWGVAP